MYSPLHTYNTNRKFKLTRDESLTQGEYRRVGGLPNPWTSRSRPSESHNWDTELSSLLLFPNPDSCVSGTLQ